MFISIIFSVNLEICCQMKHQSHQCTLKLTEFQAVQFVLNTVILFETSGTKKTNQYLCHVTEITVLEKLFEFAGEY